MRASASLTPPESASTSSTPAAATNPVARLLGAGGALLILLGLLTGGYVAAAQTGKLPVDPHAALASHLNALLGAFFAFAVAWSLPLLRYGPVGQRRLAWAVLVSNYANWIVTAVKAALHVSGVDYTGQGANDAIFGVLTATVVLPSLVAAFFWVLGFRAPKA